VLRSDFLKQRCGNDNPVTVEILETVLDDIEKLRGHIHDEPEGESRQKIAERQPFSTEPRPYVGVFIDKERVLATEETLEFFGR
jgi:hypothetical protein